MRLSNVSSRVSRHEDDCDILLDPSRLYDSLAAPNCQKLDNVQWETPGVSNGRREPSILHAQ